MKKLLLLFTLLLCISACKKDDKITNFYPPAVTHHYSPLTVGSYWIYEHFDLDTNGVETANSQTDSVYVSRDTVIGGKTYAIVVGSYFNPYTEYFFRDSAGDILSEAGSVNLWANNFTDTLQTYNSPPDWYGHIMMHQPSSPVITPAGTFNCIDRRATTYITMSGYPWDSPRYSHCYYSEGVGMVYETFFYLMSPGYIGRLLLRYHIE